MGCKATTTTIGLATAKREQLRLDADGSYAASGNPVVAEVGWTNQ